MAQWFVRDVMTRMSWRSIRPRPTVPSSTTLLKHQVHLVTGKKPGIRARRPWGDLSAAERAAVVGLGAIELVLTTAAAVDLYRRPAADVRGPKTLWWPAIFVQPVGPIAYLAFGRPRGYVSAP